MGKKARIDGERMRSLLLLVVRASLVVLSTISVLPATALASALDSIAPDPAATTLHSEETVIIPANGAVGSDVYVSSRSFLSIDFAVQPNKQVTLLVITGTQKREMDAGQQITEKPLVRGPIDGIASQSTTITQPGDYYIAILNSDPQPVSVTYRVSARAF